MHGLRYLFPPARHSLGHALSCATGNVSLGSPFQTSLLLWVLAVHPMSSLLRFPPLSLLGRWAHLGLFVWPALAVVHIIGAGEWQRAYTFKSQGYILGGNLLFFCIPMDIGTIYMTLPLPRTISICPDVTHFPPQADAEVIAALSSRWDTLGGSNIQAFKNLVALEVRSTLLDIYMLICSIRDQGCCYMISGHHGMYFLVIQYICNVLLFLCR